MVAKRSKKKSLSSQIVRIVRGELAKQHALIFMPGYNAHGKRDVTGAFRPEAQKAARLFKKASIIEFDNRQSFVTRRQRVLTMMRYEANGAGPFDVVMFFCHGWATGMQAGFNLRTVRKLAEAIRFAAPRENVRVPLYCCSTGDDIDDTPEEAIGTGEHSFADRLRDSLCELGAVHCSVMGHTTAGHTTKNPHALRFGGAGSRFGGIGGFRLVTPGSRLWPKWRRALQNDDFRYRFPHMSAACVHEELNAL